MSVNSLVARLAVPAFIFIWASGYIVAKIAAKDAEALSFLVVRYLGVTLLMLVLAYLGRAVWPNRRDAFHLAVAGLLIHALYLGGVWVSIRMGLPAGLAALIVNLQPILTACFARRTGESVSARQALGVLVGFLGVVIVLAAKFSGNHFGFSLVLPTVICFAALLGTTLGVLYQKRYAPNFDLRSGQVIQFSVSAVATLPFALLLESFSIRWSGDVIFAMVWSVFVLSGAGISIMFYLLRTGSVTRLTSTMYIVPGLTAVIAWLMFDEKLPWLVLVGMLVTLLGVYWVVKAPKDASNAVTLQKTAQ